MLSEENKLKLTDLINQAEANGETPDFIQNSLIPAFKNKYDIPEISNSEPNTLVRAVNIPVDFAKGITQDFQQRAANAGEASVKGRNIPEKALQMAGQVGGFVGDVGKRALEAGGKTVGLIPGTEKISDESIMKIVPEGISNAVTSVFGPIAEIYNRLDDNTKKDLDALVNIGSAIPIGAAGKVVAGKVIEKGAPIVTKAAEKTYEATAGRGGKSLQSAGERIQFSTIKPTKVDMDNGFDLANVYKHEVDGSLPQVLEKTDKKLSELSQQLSDEIASDPSAKVNLLDAIAKTEQELTQNKVKNFGRNSGISKAIENYVSELEAVADPSGMVSISDAQHIKRSVGKDGAWQYGMRDKDAIANETVANSLYTNIREAIEQAAPEGTRLHEINKQISELIPIEQAAIRRIPVAARNEAFGLKDMIGAAAALTNTHAWPLLAANFISKNPTAGKIMRKTGKALQGKKAPEIANEKISALRNKIKKVKPKSAP